MRDLAREELLTELRALGPQFEREGVAHLALFGSRARGDHRRNSDVDLIVDIAEGREFGLEAVGSHKSLRTISALSRALSRAEG